MVATDQSIVCGDKGLFKQQLHEVWCVKVMVERALALHSVSSLDSAKDEAFVVSEGVLNELTEELVAYRFYFFQS